MYNASEHYEGWLIENIVKNHKNLKYVRCRKAERRILSAFLLEKNNH